MITHLAGLKLKTLSIQGVKQFYHGLLHFPITRENEVEIEFQPTPDFSLVFEEVFEPLSPVHIAFEVSYSRFNSTIQQLAEQLPLLQWPDGEVVEWFDSGVNAYFKDGDGNLLEFIAHHDLKEGVLTPNGPYGVLYLREVGLPVEDPVAARLWMKRTLGLTIAKDSEQFAFVIGGTAHAVVVSTKRKWIPIAMYALAPSLDLTYGVTDDRFLDRVRSSLDRRIIVSDNENGLQFRMYGYNIRLKKTSLPKDIAFRLNLPDTSEGKGDDMDISDQYLEDGLTALSRGGEVGWFEGHVGGAYLAAYYLQKEHNLPQDVRQGLAANCRHLRSQHEDWFEPYPSELAKPELMDQLVEGLLPNLTNLSTSGHGVTLGVLGLKALRDRPDLLTPSIVRGLLKLMEDAAHEHKLARYYGIEDYTRQSLPELSFSDIPPYQDASDLASRALSELQLVLPDQHYEGKYYFFAGELEHGITHAHALIELERLGYTQLARLGQGNHQRQTILNRLRPQELAHQEIKVSDEASIMDSSYWSGLYEDPHAIKVPYAALALLQYVPQGRRVELERDVCKLLSLMK
ncbi:VOC family protein [Paenibacillus glucanolyticus]